ncbi:MAG: glycosyltransferase family 4 protein [Vicinamibacteria bacterium]
MRIAFLTTEFITESSFSGGLANYLDQVGRALVRKGHQVDIFVVSDKNEQFDHEGVTVFRVKSTLHKHYLAKRLRQTLRVLLGTLALRRAVLRRHRACPIDIVQAANYLGTGYALAKTKEIPVVTRLSSFAPMLRTANGKSAYLDEWIAEHIELISLRESQGLYAPSSMLGKLVRQYEPLEVVHLPPPFARIDVEVDESLFFEVTRGHPYLLFFGTLSRLKGIDFISRNLERILDENPGFHFVFVGRFGNEEALQRCAGRHGSRVHRVDAVRKHKLLPFVRAARAVVIPSCIDNLPNTCLESMAEGRAVLTTATSGFAGVIEDGRNGYLCDFGDDERLCSQIRRIVSLGEEELKVVGNQARRTVQSLFDVEKNSSQLVRYYEKVLETAWEKSRIEYGRGKRVLSSPKAQRAVLQAPQP